MENRSDSTKRFYRQDYKSKRQLFFIISLVLTALVLAGYIVFFHGKDKGINLDDQEYASSSEYEDSYSDDTGYGDYADSQESDIDRGQVDNENGASYGNRRSNDQYSVDYSDGNITLKIGKDKLGLISTDDVKGKNLEIFKKANIQLYQMKFREALSLYNQLPGKSPAIQLCKGLCYYKMDDWYKARDQLESAQDAIAGSGQESIQYISLRFLALTHYQLNNLEDSLDCAKRALKIDKDRELVALHNRLKRELNALEDYGTTERVNFNVVFSKMEHYATKQMVVEYLEDAYRSIGRQMDFYPDETINVILYNEKNFFDVTRSPGWAGGLYDGKIRIPIGKLENYPGFQDELKRILFHEYSHALVHRITRANRCPVWFDEGLAEFFSDDHGHKIGQIIPLNYLERGFPSSGKAVLAAYVESYSAVTYILERYKFYSIKEFLKGMGEGKNFKSAFESAFAIEYSRFLQTWGKE